MKVAKIRNKIVGENYPTFVVAEIGINHNGDINLAKKMIDAADAAGCDAVKLQKRTIDIVYSKEELDRFRESPFGRTNRQLKKGLEFGLDEYEIIDEHCKELGIMWFASCWDEKSVDFVDQFDPPCYKVASASLTANPASLITKTVSLTYISITSPESLSRESISLFSVRSPVEVIRIVLTETLVFLSFSNLVLIPLLVMIKPAFLFAIAVKKSSPSLV